MHAAGDLAGVGAVVGDAAVDGGRITHCTGKRTSIRLRSEAMWTCSRWYSSGGPWYQGIASRALDDVVAEQRRDRDERHVGHLQARGEAVEVLDDRVEDALVEVDQVHLVDAHDHVRDPQQRADERVALGLRDDALARVDQHDRQVGRRGAGDHVARVLLVPGRVGDDEAPLRGREVAVGDVDRDPLLALGAQAVGQQREVEEVVAHALAGLLDVRELVGEDLLGVVQQPADQRALAVVDRAGGREAQQVGRALGQAAGTRPAPVAVQGAGACAAAPRPLPLRARDDGRTGSRV